MVYSNNLVVAVKVNGAAQKELKDGSVLLPFESEYVIHLRNKNRTRNAVAYVYIDGDLVTPSGIVVYKNDYVDLERSTDKAVKFKFISLQSSEAVEFGKDTENSDKGMGVIEVRWHFEKERPQPPLVLCPGPYHHYPPQPWEVRPRTGGLLRGVTGGLADSMVYSASMASADSLMFCEHNAMPEAKSKGLDGCTVEGGVSTQSFREVHMDIESDYTTIRLVLKGEEPKTAVRVASRRRTVYGDDRSAPKLESKGADLGSDIVEDPRIKAEREELVQLELELIAAKKAKLQADIDALKNS